MTFWKNLLLMCCTAQIQFLQTSAMNLMPTTTKSSWMAWDLTSMNGGFAACSGSNMPWNIKLENVMLCAEDPHAVKLVDFGLAMPMPKKADGSFDAKVHFHDRVGSKSYRAPVILTANGYEGPPVDVWALGITVFSLVSGFFPLDEARPKDWRFDKLQKD